METLLCQLRYKDCSLHFSSFLSFFFILFLFMWMGFEISRVYKKINRNNDKWKREMKVISIFLLLLHFFLWIFFLSCLWKTVNEEDFSLLFIARDDDQQQHGSENELFSFKICVWNIVYFRFTKLPLVPAIIDNTRQILAYKHYHFNFFFEFSPPAWNLLKISHEGLSASNCYHNRR